MRNIDNALNNYSASNKYCAYQGSSCGFSNGLYYQQFDGSCYSVSSVSCKSDADCKNNDPDFDKCLETYPELRAGTYEIGVGTSLWPSWNQTLGSELGASLPTDPVNNFGNCSACVGCDPITCWDAINHVFHCPIGSKVYLYNAGISNEQSKALDFDFIFRI